MASTENKYIDSSNFATALAVYDDINLTIKAADGTYQYNGEYRTQLNGMLGPLIVCNDCTPPPIPCSGTITPPEGNKGLYQLSVSTGDTVDDTGAIVIYFNPQGIPDGIRVLYDGVYYNRVSSPSDGNIQSTSGVADAFTILGNQMQTCISSTPRTSYYDFFNGYNQNGWVAGSPTPQLITINTGDDVYGGAYQFSTLVIPKPNATPSDLTVEVLGPCGSTIWDIAVDCPTELPSFIGEAIGSSTDCGTTSSTFYFARFKDDTNTYPVVNNPVFLDANGVSRVTDQNYLMDNDKVITVTNGVVSAIVDCVDTPPEIPCSGTITPPQGNQGIYQLNVSTGDTVDDTGAIVIYFSPQGIPDGIRVLYDGVYYNRVSSPSDGNIQSTSGVADAFTILGNPGQSCISSTPTTSSYPFFNGYDQNGWVAGSPTPQDITINTGDDVYGGVNEFSTLVIPKPNSTPSDLTVQVLGPCGSTAWNISVDCPTELPSFIGEAIGSSTDCGTTSSNFYFARFLNSTNTYPILNNPVFLDANGVSRATDQNYLMDNDKVITVTNGVVSAIVDCVDTPPTNSITPFNSSTYNIGPDGTIAWHCANGDSTFGPGSGHDGSGPYPVLGDRVGFGAPDYNNYQFTRRKVEVEAPYAPFVYETDSDGYVISITYC